MTLAIDASTKSSGIAIFNDNKQLIYIDCFKNSSTSLFTRITSMIEQIDKLLKQRPDIHTVVLEEVIPPESNEINIKTTKALFWLQGFIAYLLFQQYNNIKLEFLYPNEWRARCGIKTGSNVSRDELKKADLEFVKQQYSKQINLENINDDIADAIGIGHAYLLGQVKEQKWISFR